MDTARRWAAICGAIAQHLPSTSPCLRSKPLLEQWLGSRATHREPGSNCFLQGAPQKQATTSNSRMMPRRTNVPRMSTARSRSVALNKAFNRPCGLSSGHCRSDRRRSRGGPCGWARPFGSWRDHAGSFGKPAFLGAPIRVGQYRALQAGAVGFLMRPRLQRRAHRMTAPCDLCNRASSKSNERCERQRHGCCRLLQACRSGERSARRDLHDCGCISPSGSAAPHRPPSRPASLRSGSAGCISPAGPTATATRS